MAFYLNCILILGALLGTYYKIIAGVSLSDLFCAGAFFSLVVQKMNRMAHDKDIIRKWTLFYLIWMGIGAATNMTFGNTQFLNYFRIFAEGLIIYCLARKTLTTRARFTRFVYMFLIYLILFVVTSKSMIEESMMIDNRFTSVDYGYGRNNFAFTNLLAIMILAFLLYKVKIKFRLLCLVFFPIFIFNIYLSASRFSIISFFLFIVFFRIWIHRRITFKEGLLYAVVLVLFPYIAAHLMESVDANVLAGSQQIFEGKIGTTQEDGMSTRLMALNFSLIAAWVEMQPFYQIIVGDGLSICHGIFAQTFLATGIIGFVIYVGSNFHMVNYLRKKSGAYSYAAFIIVVMFMNDIVTNARFIIHVNNILFMLIIAILVSYAEITEKGEKSRICA